MPELRLRVRKRKNEVRTRTSFFAARGYSFWGQRTVTPKALPRMGGLGDHQTTPRFRGLREPTVTD